MSIIQFPSTLSASELSWAQQRNDVEFRSAFGAQAQEASAPLWTVSISASLEPADAGAWQALMLTLRGKTNQLALWNIGRPTPLGTMRGTMTMAAAAQGATAMTITASGQASKTLLAGDYLGVGTGLTQQVVMICADATSNTSGVITVAIEPPLRNAFAAASPVTWDKPRALFRRKDSASRWEYEQNLAVRGMMLSLLEDWRP